MLIIYNTSFLSSVDNICLCFFFSGKFGKNVVTVDDQVCTKIV